MKLVSKDGVLVKHEHPKNSFSLNLGNRDLEITLLNLLGRKYIINVTNEFGFNQMKKKITTIRKNKKYNYPIGHPSAGKPMSNDDFLAKAVREYHCIESKDTMISENNYNDLLKFIHLNLIAFNNNLDYKNEDNFDVIAELIANTDECCITSSVLAILDNLYDKSKQFPK